MRNFQLRLMGRRGAGRSRGGGGGRAHARAGTHRRRLQRFAWISPANWAVTTNEDQPAPRAGSGAGRLHGAPDNAAGASEGRSVGRARFCRSPSGSAQAHPVQYRMRGPGPNLRILKSSTRSPRAHFAYTIAGVFGRADRIIYLDGRNHPSDYSEHTWDGYSTGQWDANGHFIVSTTHMKYGVIQRNGVAGQPLRHDDRALLPPRALPHVCSRPRRSDLPRRADGADRRPGRGTRAQNLALGQCV